MLNLKICTGVACIFTIFKISVAQSTEDLDIFDGIALTKVGNRTSRDDLDVYFLEKLLTNELDKEKKIRFSQTLQSNADHDDNGRRKDIPHKDAEDDSKTGIPNKSEDEAGKTQGTTRVLPINGEEEYDSPEMLDKLQEFVTDKYIKDEETATENPEQLKKDISVHLRDEDLMTIIDLFHLEGSLLPFSQDNVLRPVHYKSYPCPCDRNVCQKTYYPPENYDNDPKTTDDSDFFVRYSALCYDEDMGGYSPVSEFKCQDDSVLCSRDQYSKARCKNVFKESLSKTNAGKIVAIHNFIRALVVQGFVLADHGGSTVGDMKKLRWDISLAKKAQSLVNSCDDLKLDCDKCINPDGQHEGQVVFHARSRGLAPAKILERIFAVLVTSGGNLTSPAVKNFHGVGDAVAFSQMVWSDTDRIGCGILQRLISVPGYIYSNSSKGSVKRMDWVDTTLACNYSPAGNVIGHPVYHEGPVCGACPDGKKCDHKGTGLCISSRKPRDPKKQG